MFSPSHNGFLPNRWPSVTLLDTLLLWARGCGVYSRGFYAMALYQKKKSKLFFVKWLTCGNNINNYFLCALLTAFKLAWTNISFNAFTLMVKYGLSGSSTSGNLFLLYVHAVNHFDNELSPKETQGLFQWLSSSDWDYHILWYYFPCVCNTQVPRPLESQFTNYRAASPACCGTAAFKLYLSSMA